MRVEDYYPKGKRWWVRLHEKGGKRHEMPAHHNLEAYLDAYIEATGIRDGGKAPLFRSAAGRTGTLTATAMNRVDAWRMIQRRAAELGTRARIGCHTFRATGITACLELAACWRTRKPWPRMKARARRSSTTAPATRLRSMRSSESRSSSGNGK
jgi:integrase